MDSSDRLAEIEERYERLQAEMAEPNVARDQDRLRRLGKELAELGEIVVPYREYLADLPHINGPNKELALMRRNSVAQHLACNRRALHTFFHRLEVQHAS